MADFFDVRGLARRVTTLIIGTLTIGTALVLGSSSSVTGDLIPTTDATYIVGTSTKQWLNGSFSGTVSAGSVSSSNVLFTNATGTKLVATAVSSSSFVAAPSSAAAVAYSFTGDPSTGMYSGGTNDVRLVTGGSSRLQIDSSGTLNFGGAIVPFTNNARDLGTPTLSLRSIYTSTTIQSGGATSSFLAGAGTAPLPAYSFIGDPDTGIYSTGANSVGVSLGGSQELSLSNLVLRPGAASGLDLGSVTVPWLNVYASGTANLDTIAVVTSTFSSTSTHNGVSNTGLMATDGGVDFYSTTGTEHVAALPVTGTGNLGFVFSAVSDVTSANLFTIREGGTNRMTLNGSGLLNVGSATISTTLTSNGNTALAAVTSSSATVDFPNIGAPGVTQDLVCWTATLGRLTHQATTCTVSSARFKENIKSMSPDEMLKKVMALRSVSFDWKPGMEPDHGINGGGKESNGFIAEEVALIDPMLVVYTDEYTPEDLTFVKKNYPSSILKKDGKTLIPKTIDYARVSVYTTGAIQAQQAQIDDIKRSMNEQKSLLTVIMDFLKGIIS